MCQQTRIETALPYYTRFLAQWPTIEHLAAAELDEVLREWAGLGYYSRARNLHKAARVVVDLGGFPETAKALQALPGVGAYTAAAIASIAFEEDAHLVDGNVERVLSRYFGMALCVRSPAGKKALWDRAQSILPSGKARHWNQALMEWGALLCSPKNPKCGQCPVANDCVARLESRIEALPFKSKKTKSKRVHATCGVWFSEGKVLLNRRAENGLLGGLWECPGTAMSDEAQDHEVFASAWLACTGIKFKSADPLGEVRHVFTHLNLRQKVLLLNGNPGVLPERAGLRWVPIDQISQFGLSRLTQKVLELASKAQP
jgi:A/G-specific adenine glycosylase